MALFPFRSAIFLLVYAASLYAQAAGTRSPVFDAKADARVQGTGGAAVMLPQHLGAVFENPGLAGTLRDYCVSTTYIKQFFDEQLYAAQAGYGSALGSWGAGFGWTQLTSGAMPYTRFVYDSSGQHVYDNSGNMVTDTAGFFNDISNGVYLAFGSRVLDNLYLGITAKFLARTLADSTRYTAGVDAGMYYPLMNSRVTLGASVKDVVPAQLTGDDTATVERMAAAGVSIAFLERRLIFSAQVENCMHQSFDKTGSLGIEWQVVEPLALRAGMNADSYSLGVSIMIKGVFVHYAVVNHNDFGLDNPHRLTLEYYFGGKNSL